MTQPMPEQKPRDEFGHTMELCCCCRKYKSPYRMDWLGDRHRCADCRMIYETLYDDDTALSRHYHEDKS